MQPSANIVQGRRIQAARFAVESLLTWGRTRSSTLNDARITRSPTRKRNASGTIPSIASTTGPHTTESAASSSPDACRFNPSSSPLRMMPYPITIPGR